jgi:hypothetical protein
MKKALSVSTDVQDIALASQRAIEALTKGARQ